MATMPRKPYANAAVNSAVRKLDKEYADAFEQLRVYLERELAKLNRDGQLLVKDRFNIRMINKTILPELQRKARELGFGDVIKAQTDELKGLAKEVLREAYDLPDAANKFLATTGENIKSLMLDGQRAVVSTESKVARELESILRRSGNVRWDDLVGSISEKLNTTARNAMNEAASTMATFHTQTRVEHFEDRDSKGHIRGVKWWLYDGPRDERNRNFCSHFVGTRVTIAILNQHNHRFDRKHPLPASISLGGYQCRHELIPLPTPEMYNKYMIKPMVGLAPAKPKPKKKAAA